MKVIDLNSYTKEYNFEVLQCYQSKDLSMISCAPCRIQLSQRISEHKQFTTTALSAVLLSACTQTA